MEKETRDSSSKRVKRVALKYTLHYNDEFLPVWKMFQRLLKLDKTIPVNDVKKIRDTEHLTAFWFRRAIGRYVAEEQQKHLAELPDEDEEDAGEEEQET